MLGRARRGSRARAALVAALLVGALLPMLGRSPSAAATTSFAMTTFGDLVVDPGTGRVFVSGDDKVLAFSAGGAAAGTISGVTSARGMVVSNGYLWVVESAGSIAKVNPSTLAKVGELAAGSALGLGITAIGTTLYVTVDAGDQSDVELLSVDETTGAVAHKGIVQGPVVRAVPGAPTHLLSGNLGVMAYSMQLYDISGATATSIGDAGFLDAGSLSDIAVTDVGTAVVASPNPYHFEEFGLTPEDSVLQKTGVVYAGDAFPVGVATSSAGGGVVAGSVSSTSGELYVSRRGTPLLTHHIALPGDPVHSGVALSKDAKTAYVVVDGTSAGQLRLVTTALAPTLAAVSSKAAVPGRTIRSVVTGTGLGSITAVTLGGAPVEFAHDGPDRLQLDVRTSLPPGAATLAMTGPLGNLATTFTVSANATGIVRGKVTRAGKAVSGAAISLQPPSGAVRTATSASDGSWSIANVAAGAHVDLTVAGAGATVHLDDRTLSAPGPWTFDVDVLTPPARSIEHRRVALPAGEVRNVTTDPVTGRTFVAVGDQIVAFDAGGNELARIRDQWTVNELQVVGGKLYAMLTQAGRVSQIDVATLTVDRTIALRRAIGPSFVVVGTKLFFHIDFEGFPAMESIDLGTGAISGPGASENVSRFAPIDGLPQHFLGFELGSSAAHWNAATGSAVLVKSTSDYPFEVPNEDVVASSTADRIWGADGTEAVLSTMKATATRFPTTGTAQAIARSDGHGGLLAVGQSLYRPESTTETHRFTAAPAIRSLSLAADGETAYVATADGSFVTDRLTPVVASVSPRPVVEQPTLVVATGSGLGGVTAAAIDGSPVTFTRVDATKVDVSVSGLADGWHELTITTPWGTSSPIGIPVGAKTVGNAYAPFSSWSALVKRVTTDLTGAAPSASSLASWVAALSGGTKTKGDLVAALRAGSDNTSAVDPTARLYRAFLGRTPDASGLKFWVGRRRAGTWSLTRMADSFATSNEFTKKYGSLTNRQFVTRIYTDVLGRAADSSGVDYWTGKLDRREKSRGAVMVGFSESSEYKRKQAENTDVAVSYIFLLGRTPSAGEVTTWVTDQKGGTSLAVLAAQLLDSAAYGTHITG